MKKEKDIITINNTFTEFLLYKTSDGRVKVEIFLYNENIWLTQARIAELFFTTKQNISLHLKNIFTEKELNENLVVKDFLTTASDGKKYKTKFYNLDTIIAVGYRVNSKQATHFRIWANNILKEYIIKGFVMDDERLKNPQQVFGKDYFEEQLARIRDIRSSERRFYQKITDIYVQCSADYNSDENITKEFFATVQNKLHFAITGKTAAEIINFRVDNKKINMGLTSWKNSPNGKIRKTDISIAKNYLNKEELENLNKIVTVYLEFAEMQAKAGKIMYMKDWIKKLNEFLKFTEKDILEDSGKVSHEVAIFLAEKEFKKFSQIQDKDYISDFDREVSKLLNS